MLQIFEKSYWKAEAKRSLEIAIKYREEGFGIIHDNVTKGAFKKIPLQRIQGLYNAECARLWQRAVNETRIALQARPVIAKYAIMKNNTIIEGAAYAQ